MPEALSSAPGETPRLSRWARMTIARCAWGFAGPVRGAVATTLTSSSVPKPGMSAENVCRSTEKPYSLSWLSTQSAASRWPSVPGERSGKLVARSVANWSAVALSKNGWVRGGVSASGLPTLKAATSTGTATTSQAAR